MCHNLDLLPVPIVVENYILECGIVFLKNTVIKERYTFVASAAENII